MMLKLNLNINTDVCVVCEKRDFKDNMVDAKRSWGSKAYIHTACRRERDGLCICPQCKGTGEIAKQ